MFICTDPTSTAATPRSLVTATVTEIVSLMVTEELESET
jgi:hypothetical protein